MTSTSPVHASRTAQLRPTVSPQHGVYVVLLLSFGLGVAAAHTVNGATLLALIAAFCGFQAEHPLMRQLKQRQSWQPRFLVWSGIYGGGALAAAAALYWQQGAGFSPLLGIYGAAVAALGVDAIAVYRRGQRSIANELVTFAAVCLSAPLAYVASTGTLPLPLLGLWALCTLTFSSTIFTVKLRKPQRDEPAARPLWRVGIYHGLALLLLGSLYGLGLLSGLLALAFGPVLLKLALIGGRLAAYRNAPMGQVAALETSCSLLFAAIAAAALLTR